MKLLLLFPSLLVSSLLAAQVPANDDCAGAIDLGDVPFCSNPGEYTNVNATTSIIDPGSNVPSCFNNLADRDVWFRFTMPANGSITDVTISILGDIGGNGTLRMPQVALYRGDCAVPDLTELDCAAAPLNVNEVSLDFLDLIPGESYYLRVNDYSATAAPNAGTFKLCVTEYIADFNMGEVPGTESCSGTLWDSGGETNDYGQNENFTFTICPTEFHQCIQINIAEFATENNFDVLQVYEGNGITGPLLAEFEGFGTDEQVNVSGGGCATIAFSSDNSVTDDGFMLTWLCTPDVCPAPPPVPPSASTCDAALPINGCDVDLPNVINLEPGMGDPDFIVDGVNAGCILGPSAELNFSFFYFQAQSDGEFSFLVKNNDPANPSDIDFSVWGPIDSVSQICDFVSNNQPVRSSWTAAPSLENPEGLTGLTNTNPYTGVPVTDEFDCGSPATPGQGILPDDDSFVSALPVQQGKIYVVLLDDYDGAVESEDGISIDFAGTTANVLDPVPGLTIQVSSDTAICPGQSVQLQVTGGYDYAWSPANTLSCADCPNPVATPFENTTYIVQAATTCGVVKDSVRVQFVDLELGPDINVCLGASFTLNENAIPGSYSWVGGTGLSCTDCPSPVFTANQTGIIILSATVSLGGCSDTDIIRITVAGGQQPEVTISPDTAICVGESLSLGGPSSPGYSYTWTSSPPGFSSSLSDPPAVSPTVSTTYYLETFGNVCIYPRIDSVVVRVYQQPVVSLIGGAVFCLGESVVLGTTQPQSAVSFSWSPDNGSLNNINIANPTATPATPGLHTYTVTAENPGCSVTESVSVVAVELSLEFNVPDTVLICKGNSVEINATVVPAASQVSWSPLIELILSPDGQQAIASPEENTTYTATVALPGCSKTKQIFVKVDSLPEFLRISPMDTSICKGQQVTLKWPDSDPLYEPGLFPDMTFAWEPLTGQLTPDTLPFMVVQPTDSTLYRRVATNGACTDTAYAQVNVIEPPEMTIFPELSTICPDSFILLMATAPGIDSLLWTPSNSLSCEDCLNPIATPTTTTTYNLSGKYEGCPVAKTATIIVNPAPVYEFPNVLEKCAGDELQLNLLDDPSVQTYTWSSNPPSTIPGIAQPTVTLEGMGMQSVTYYLYANNGCVVEDSFTVTFTGFTLDLTEPDTICPETQVLLSATASLGGGTYVWSGADPGQALSVTPEATATYTVMYTLNGCTVEDSVEIVVQGTLPEVDFPDDVVLCMGDSIVLNTIETPGATYTWTSSPGLIIPGEATPPAFPLFESTIFTVEATLGECTIVRDLDVTVLQASVTVSDDIETCSGIPFTISATGTATGTYQWTPGPDEPTFTDVINGEQTVDYALLYTYGNAGNQCFIEDTVTVTTLAGFNAVIAADPDSAFNAGDPIFLDAVIQPSQSINGFTFAWVENGASPVGSTQQINLTPETTDTTISYTVRVINPDGCADTATIRLRVYQPDVYIPNAFTPNGDDANDSFGLVILEGKATIEDFVVYNRWGQKVFESQEPAARWDGKVDGEVAPSDVYVYQIKWRRGDGSLVIDSGEVTLLR